ncbi:MAG: fumarylacetoacetate hydrolase family protein [Hyphomicrobiales bacterium]
MALLLDPPPQILAEVHGHDDVVPVRRVFCVGRNYAAHAREMGKDPDREPPFFFTKWAETVVPGGSTIAYPLATEDYHWEIELVAVIGLSGIKIPAASARDHIIGYAVGLDMTRRDLQARAKEMGRPWDTGKNGVQSAPLGPIHLARDAGHIDTGRISLEVNGELKQDGDIADLIWSIDEVIEHLSGLYRLEPGDLIYTGTPAGVGAAKPGDRLVGCVAGLSDLEITIGPREA